ncbi:MAG: hypothetical protein K2J72_10365 [Oscillospiraceae bacterium]|nr:hypothetical protein [Oscillospiraceae bacterium]
MKDYFETKSRKSASYFYYGLIAAGLAALMIVTGIISVARSTGVWVAVTSFASAAVWGITAFVSLYIFYTDNRSELSADKLDSEEL